MRVPTGVVNTKPRLRPLLGSPPALRLLLADSRLLLGVEVGKEPLYLFAFATSLGRHADRAGGVSSGRLLREHSKRTWDRDARQSQHCVAVLQGPRGWNIRSYVRCQSV